ncbi:MAG: alcohol acetyltransferase, partial [Cyanobacteria bacterium P01_A01_bin.84]
IANTVDVSNIGRVEINDNYGAFKLDEISFIPSCTILANTILVAVTSFKQQMILNFATSEPSVSQLTREILANNVINYLSK